MVAVSSILRSARKSRKVSQAELSARTHIFQGDVSRYERGSEATFSTVDRLLAGTGHGLYSAPTRRDDAASVAQEIRRCLKVSDRLGALRALIQLNDNLRAEAGIVRGILGLAEPETTNEPVWDSAIAALVAWRFKEEGLPAPLWVTAPSTFLARPHDLSVDPADPTPPDSQVPDEFLKRGVRVWRDTFVSF